LIAYQANTPVGRREVGSAAMKQPSIEYSCLAGPSENEFLVAELDITCRWAKRNTLATGQDDQWPIRSCEFVEIISTVDLAGQAAIRCPLG
jgi:hypothetical protein